MKNAKPSNLNVLKEYRKREEEFLRRAHELDEVTMQRDGAKKLYDELRKQRLEEFMSAFNVISAKLKEMYQVRDALRTFAKDDVALDKDDHFWWKRRIGTRG